MSRSQINLKKTRGGKDDHNKTQEVDSDTDDGMSKEIAMKLGYND